MKQPQYIIESHEHGWLIIAPQFQKGIAVDDFLTAMKEIQKSSGPDAVMAIGVDNYYREFEGKNIVTAITTKTGFQLWKDEVEKTLADIKTLSAEERWFYGTDTRLSSKAMFRVLCPPYIQVRNRIPDEGHTPQDADDFGRCIRLLKRFPSWEMRVGEVAIAYPSSKWPAIAAAWGTLTDPLQNSRENQDALLRAIHESRP